MCGIWQRGGKPGQSLYREATENVTKSRTAVFSLCITILLAVLKVAVAILSGSVSVIAEAVNNTLDLITSLVTLLAVRISDKPADEGHPYGHGKIESLSALVTVGFLSAIYLYVLGEAINRLISPQPIENELLSIAVIVFGIAANLVRVSIVTRAARKYRSQALAADALNFRTDMFSSSIVLVVLVLSLLSNGNPLLQRADAIGAIVVSAIVLLFTTRLGKQAIDTLLDRAPSKLAEHIEREALLVPGVVAVSSVRAREVGAQLFVDLTASVPRSMSLEGSHDIATEIEARVRAYVRADTPNADVLVRIAPIVPEHESLVDDIHAAAVRAGKAVHNISVREVGQDKHVHLDLEVSGRLDLQAAHNIATELEHSLKEQFHLTHISVHIEPMNEPIQARAVGQQPATVMEIQRIAHDDPRIQRIDNIVLDRVGSQLNLAFDCQFRGNMSLTDAHLAAEHLEQSLRRHLPNLGEVLIHTEPEGADDVT
jgi:cation diffusion facilitator family transporter